MLIPLSTWIVYLRLNSLVSSKEITKLYFAAWTHQLSVVEQLLHWGKKKGGGRALQQHISLPILSSQEVYTKLASTTDSPFNCITQARNVQENIMCLSYYRTAARTSVNTANQMSDILWYQMKNKFMYCSCVNTKCNKHLYNLRGRNNSM